MIMRSMMCLISGFLTILTIWPSDPCGIIFPLNMWGSSSCSGPSPRSRRRPLSLSVHKKFSPLSQLAATFPMDTTNTENKRNSNTWIKIKVFCQFDLTFQMFQFCCRSIFSNFSIENILSENIAEEKNEKVMDVNVLKKIKQEKIELLGNILLKYFVCLISLY